MPKKNADFKTTIVKNLKFKKQELLQTLDRLRESRREYEGQLTAGDFIEEVDDAQRQVSAYSQFSLIERKHRELRKIEYLLSRVAKEQDFGLCEECGTQIPKERLLLVPEATLCVACQRELERTDSRMFTASQSTELSPVRGHGSLETAEPSEEDYDALTEYRIDTLTDEDLDENEPEVPSEEHKDAKGS